MSSSPKQKTKTVQLITPEDLDIEDLGSKYTLGVSEIIAKRIIDIILQRVTNSISLHHTYSLERAYIMRKTYEIYSQCVNINTMKPQEETETPEDDGIIDIPTPKIDTWASNKTKIEKVDKQQLANKDIENKESIANKFKSLATNKKTSKMEERPSIKRTKTMKSAILDKNTKKTGIDSPENVKTGLVPRKNEKDKEINKPYPQFPLEITDQPEVVDETELMRDRGLRAYFKERESEKQRKLKLEQEHEEYAKEMEKLKKNQRNEDYYKRPYFYNSEGKLEYIKIPDLEKVPVYDAPIYLIKNKGEAKVNDEIAQLVSKNQGSMFELDPELMDYTKISKPEPTVYNLKATTFYQPDPMESHQIEKGVTFKYYEQVKNGGGFPNIPGRMTDKEFQEIIKKMKPKQKNLDMLRVFDDDQQGINGGASKQISKEHSLIDEAMDAFDGSGFNKQTSIKNLYNFLYEDDSGANIKEKKLRKEFKSLEFLSPKRRLLFIKKMLEEKKKKLEADRRDKAKVTKHTDFQFEQLEKYNDERIYEKDKNTNRKPVSDSLYEAEGSVKFHNPINPHVPYEKELGHMKKYPRERMAKDLLVSTGKLAITNVETKSKYDKKNPQSSQILRTKSKINDDVVKNDIKSSNNIKK